MGIGIHIVLCLSVLISLAQRQTVLDLPLISLILEHREDMNLSAEQVRTIQGLRSEFQKQALARNAELQVAEIELNELMNADSVDSAKVDAKVKQIEMLNAENRMASIRIGQQAKAVLTPAQQMQLDALVREKSLPVVQGGVPVGDVREQIQTILEKSFAIVRWLRSKPLTL